jgi:hypothetical protein
MTCTSWSHCRLLTSEGLDCFVYALRSSPNMPLFSMPYHFKNRQPTITRLKYSKKNLLLQVASNNLVLHSTTINFTGLYLLVLISVQFIIKIFFMIFIYTHSYRRISYLYIFSWRISCYYNLISTLFICATSKSEALITGFPSDASSEIP